MTERGCWLQWSAVLCCAALDSGNVRTYLALIPDLVPSKTRTATHHAAPRSFSCSIRAPALPTIRRGLTAFGSLLLPRIVCDSPNGGESELSGLEL
jgi:hypothetical protein